VASKVFEHAFSPALVNAASALVGFKAATSHILDRIVRKGGTEMSDERCCSGSGGIMLAFLAGGLVGAGLALLYAPPPGARPGSGSAGWRRI